MIHPKIVLHYFDARGRAQFIRYYLTVRNVDFVDRRVPLEPDFGSWLAIRKDRSVSGPFLRLPVMHWGDELIAETPVIASFLHRHFGDEDILGGLASRRHQQIMSSLYGDMLTQIGTLIWAEVIYAGLDFAPFVQRTFERTKSHVGSLETTLAEWEWLNSMDKRPIMIADCMIWETLDALMTIFGPHFDLSSWPILQKIHERYAHGTAFSTLLQSHPCPITARDREADVIGRIRAIVAAA
jgi:glutathione S-transferase